ncbi:MAG: hypothetical protein PUK69_00570 [Clostridiales bacterium]|nr:hypothetical protein [Clostridiales bacterium]MDY5675515.1 hypothetical protein [Eubacteriales bacterium]
MAKEIKREVVKASEAKAEAEKAPKKKKVDTETGEKEVVQAKPTGNAALKRVFAVVFWLLAIAAEVAAIMLLNGYLYIPYDLKTLLIIAIALDLIFVIIGSQFWKKANHINPPSEKNKVWFFLCSQMGLIVAVIAFCPLIVLLLKNKDKLDKKTKVIVTVIAAVALLVAGACSIDYDPVSQESLAEAKSEVSELTDDGTVYWTRYGRSYHCDINCHTLARSSTLYEGTIEEAFAARRNDPCDYCADGKEAKLSERNAGDAADNTADGEPAAEAAE